MTIDKESLKREFCGLGVKNPEVTLDRLDWVIGIDPGPEYTAVAAMRMRPSDVWSGYPGVSWAYLNSLRLAYIPTPPEGGFTGVDIYLALFDGNTVFPTENCMIVYEKAAHYGRTVGAHVFGTCMAAGRVVQGLVDSDRIRVLAVEGVPSPEWRRALLGRSNARNPETRAKIDDLIPGVDARVREAAKTAKAGGIPKPAGEHLRDAVAVALYPAALLHNFGDDSLWKLKAN